MRSVQNSTVKSQQWEWFGESVVSYHLEIRLCLRCCTVHTEMGSALIWKSLWRGLADKAGRSRTGQSKVGLCPGLLFSRSLRKNHCVFQRDPIFPTDSWRAGTGRQETVAICWESGIGAEPLSPAAWMLKSASLDEIKQQPSLKLSSWVFKSFVSLFLYIHECVLSFAL